MASATVAFFLKKLEIVGLFLNAICVISWLFLVEGTTNLLVIFSHKFVKFFLNYTASLKG
jgi:hypothetical protein